MRQRVKAPLASLATSTLVLAISAPTYGQEKVTTPPATPAKASAGPLNDWLRGECAAFNRWDIGGQFRARVEFKNNGGSDGKYANEDFMKAPPGGKIDDNAFLFLREKLHVGYTPCAWMGFYAEGRDGSSTSDQRHPNPGADEYDLHQANIVLGNLKQFPLVAKMGRQELMYGDERMVGVADWGNLGRSFEAAKLRYENTQVWVDAFVGRVVMPANHEFNQPNEHGLLTGVYASTETLIPVQETQAYFLSHNVGDESTPAANPAWIASPSKPQDTRTIGLRLKSLPGKLGAWDYTAEVAGQFGRITGKRGGATTRLDQEAFTLSLTGGYTWKHTIWSPRLSLGYDFASGDGDPNDGRSGTFEPIFPTNHRSYGYMDLTGPRNIHDPRVGVALKPAKGLAVSLDYHLFVLADTQDYFYPESGSGRGTNGYGLHPGYSNFVGSELDLDATYAIKPWFVVRAGYGHFFVGDYITRSLAAAGGAQDADWLYVQTVVSF